MITLYGNKLSNSCCKVEYVLKLLNIPYDYKELDFQKDLKTPEHLKRHPAGKIPVLDDNGFVIFESNTICRYLCTKQVSQLYPYDLKKRTIIDQWLDFCSIHVGLAVSQVAFNRVFAPQLGLPVNEASIQEGLKNIDRFLPLIEKQLQQHPYMTGETITVADINLLAILQYAEGAHITLTSYPHLTEWQKKLKAMDFYKQVHNQ